MNSEKFMINSIVRAKRQAVGSGRPYRSVLFAIVCMAVAVFAQDGALTVNDIEVRAGSRGMMLVITGTGPIRIDIPGSAAAQYPELRVKINNARSALGARQVFAAPEGLPVRDITLTDAADGVTVIVKARGMFNGPVDTRSSGNQARILMTRDSLPEMNWNPTKGMAPVPVAQAQITPEPVDMKKMQERAVRDTQKTAGGDMFTVSGKPQTSRARAAAPQVAKKSETPTAEVTKKSPEGDLVRYKVYGRDPFVPLAKDTSLTDIPRVENLRLVGVLEDAHERIALVEDFKNGNRAFALRANDPVEFGRVLRIQRDKVVFVIREFDISKSYTLSLSR